MSQEGTGLVGSAEPWGSGAQPNHGAPSPPYLDSPLPIPPGDLVRSVAGERDVLLHVGTLGYLLCGSDELEKITCSRQLLQRPSPPGPWGTEGGQ